jgi:hypothetical protein
MPAGILPLVTLERPKGEGVGYLLARTLNDEQKSGPWLPSCRNKDLRYSLLLAASQPRTAQFLFTFAATKPKISWSGLLQAL